MDFSSVQSEHILTAFKQLDRGEKLNGFGESTTYDVSHNGKLYPPKLLLALAYKNATGKELKGSDFSGGKGTPCFHHLNKLGFTIIDKVNSVVQSDSPKLNYWIGVTDRSWFEFHSANQSLEVNFWAPGGERSFGAISEGGLFLFKLKSPINKIVGGGWFLKSTTLPLELAWKVYAKGNGADTLSLFRENISKMRAKMSKSTGPNETIGCTLLTDCFWLPEDQWITQPSDWSPNIVQGKCYEPREGEGARVWLQIQERLKARPISSSVEQEQDRYGTPYMAKPRLGQAGFRVAVLDAYGRRCAVTEEKTLPVLEAAHIRPYADGGGHEVANGLLLRSDFHTLFDAGYLTIDTDYRLLVSKRLREEFSNGRHYYEHHGKIVPNLPTQTDMRPSRAVIVWRNEGWKS
jgi:putative restriction endonuclease